MWPFNKPENIEEKPKKIRKDCLIHIEYIDEEKYTRTFTQTVKGMISPNTWWAGHHAHRMMQDTNFFRISDNPEKYIPRSKVESIVLEEIEVEI